MKQNDLNFTPQAVILGNGDFPSHTIPTSLLEQTPFVVCCDGAANNFLDRGFVPDLIIGDGDSISDSYRHSYASILRINPDQETNDQTKAVEYLADKGFDKIAIVGATGRREDHTIGNISLLIEYMSRGIDARIYTDYGVFIAAEGDNEFICPPKTQISIFGFGTSGMCSEGLAYPIRDFTSWWQGTLNETQGDSFIIRCKGKYLVFVNYQ